MDDPPLSVSRQRAVVRRCETSRLQEQLLARAYQQLFPEVRRPMDNDRMKEKLSTAATGGQRREVIHVAM